MVLFFKISMFKGTGSIYIWASIKIFTSVAMVTFHNPFEIVFMVPLTWRGYGSLLRLFKRSTTSRWFFLQYCLKDEDVKMDDS